MSAPNVKNNILNGLDAFDEDLDDRSMMNAPPAPPAIEVLSTDRSNPENRSLIVLGPPTESNAEFPQDSTPVQVYQDGHDSAPGLMIISNGRINGLVNLSNKESALWELMRKADKAALKMHEEPVKDIVSIKAKNRILEKAFRNVEKKVGNLEEELKAETKKMRRKTKKLEDEIRHNTKKLEDEMKEMIVFFKSENIQLKAENAVLEHELARCCEVMGHVL